MHVDCDAFFASVEQALHPEFKGKPVITGAERGIVAAASYEAKAAGIKRGMRLGEVTRICPSAILLSSDYETYSLFSKRLFDILRRFTPTVEEYSIDEAFCDLTGIRRLHRTSYEEIGGHIQAYVVHELGITVSVGISLTKSLAKLCSKYKKPAGLTSVPGRHIDSFLERIALKDVWGFGPATTALLQKYGLKTAYDFIERPLSFAEKLMGKVGAEIWMELRGEYVYEVSIEEKQSYASISKAKTFTPASNDPNYVFAHALRNLESACIKARRYNLAARKLLLYLRTERFDTVGVEVNLNRATASVTDMTEVLKSLFVSIFKIGKRYRQTNVVLAELCDAGTMQMTLFEDPLRVLNSERLSHAIDEVNRDHGKHTVFMADGLHLDRHPNARKRLTERQETPLPGETRRKHLRLPILH